LKIVTFIYQYNYKQHTNSTHRLNMTPQIHIMNVRLPNDTIDWLDKLVQQGIYNSRSEAIREFVREHIKEE